MVFDRGPDDFIHRLIMLAEYLFMRDLTENMIRWATTGNDSRLRCWTALTEKLDKMQKPSLETEPSHNVETDQHVTATKDAILRFKKLQIEEKSLSSTVEKSIAFLKQTIKDTPEEVASESTVFLLLSIPLLTCLLSSAVC